MRCNAITKKKTQCSLDAWYDDGKCHIHSKHHIPKKYSTRPQWKPVENKDGFEGVIEKLGLYRADFPRHFQVHSVTSHSCRSMTYKFHVDRWKGHHSKHGSYTNTQRNQNRTFRSRAKG